MFLKNSLDEKFFDNWDGDYNSSIGRFISEDPDGLFQSFTNLYIFVYNNPIVLFDPDGGGISGDERKAWVGVIDYIVFKLDMKRLEEKERKNVEFNKAADRERLLNALDEGFIEELIKNQYPFIDLELPFENPEDLFRFYLVPPPQDEPAVNCPSGGVA
ncbi:MAG: hypothetical protein NXH75_17205 [Halobacteriovoraceae bacterium]|nr:hypothetical protein [Halobacteriovoraceae bacterium]